MCFCSSWNFVDGLECLVLSAIYTIDAQRLV
jgi:hypothetical protein